MKLAIQKRDLWLVLAVVVIGGAIWHIHSRSAVSPVSVGASWHYRLDSGEGGSEWALIEDAEGITQCSVSDSTSDVFNDTELRALADIVLSKRCVLLPGQLPDTNVTTWYGFWPVTSGYVTTIGDARSSDKITVVHIDTKEPYTAKVLWQLPAHSAIVGTDSGNSYLVRTCGFDGIHGVDVPGSCSLILYGSDGNLLKQVYSEQGSRQLQFGGTFYDSINNGFLIVGISRAADDVRTFDYHFLHVANNPNHTLISLGTFTDKVPPPAKGCGNGFKSEPGSLSVSGCSAPTGYPDPFVLLLPK